MKLYSEIVVMVMMNTLSAAGVARVVDGGYYYGSSVRGMILAVIVAATVIKDVCHILEITKWVKARIETRKFRKEFLDDWKRWDAGKRVPAEK